MKALEQRYAITFMETVHAIPGARGREIFNVGPMENHMVAWSGISFELKQALLSLVEERKIVVMGIDSSFYRILKEEYQKHPGNESIVDVCERLMNLPRASMDDALEQKHYDDAHWLPAMILLRPPEDHLDSLMFQSYTKDGQQKYEA
ncbi:MAG TPA: hypothetical protein VIS48_12945 [Candidatus Kryptonia bacterium]